ncbi:MAG: hypothetical protein U5K27_13735 [Desulfotignum sp.]|nr:hypothetical protein [Desulfotignum sp.]
MTHADAVVLWLDTPTKNVHNYPEEEKNSRQSMIGMLDSHLPMDRDDFSRSIEMLLTDEDFGDFNTGIVRGWF